MNKRGNLIIIILIGVVILLSWNNLASTRQLVKPEQEYDSLRLVVTYDDGKSFIKEITNLGTL